MLADAKDKKFEVLVVHDLSRLSRDSVETEQARRRLVHWGVRLVSIGDGVDSDNEGHELMSGFKGLMNQQFLKDLAKHVRRGMVGQVLKGYHGGGRTYGYKLVPEYSTTEKDPYGQPARIGSRLAIDREQARHREADLSGLCGRPLSGQDRRGAESRGGPTTGHPLPAQVQPEADLVRPALYGNPKYGLGLLNCPTYKGELVWGKSKWTKDPDTKKKRRSLCEEPDWIRTPAPHLRIIDNQLWERVKQRQAAMHHASGAIRAALHANAQDGSRPKYLFSGLLACGQCGRKFVVVSPTEYAC